LRTKNTDLSGKTPICLSIPTRQIHTDTNMVHANHRRVNGDNRRSPRLSECGADVLVDFGTELVRYQLTFFSFYDFVLAHCRLPPISSYSINSRPNHGSLFPKLSPQMTVSEHILSASWLFPLPFHIQSTKN
jgi:hypothetical protein